MGYASPRPGRDASVVPGRDAPCRDPSRSRTQARNAARRMPHTLSRAEGRGRRAATGIGMALKLDLDVDPGGKVELRQGVHRLRRRVQDVEEPLVSADLELLAGLLVHVGRAEHRPATDRGREQDGPGHSGPGPSHGLHDLLDRPVQESVIVGPKADADFLIDEQRHFLSLRAVTRTEPIEDAGPRPSEAYAPYVEAGR